MVTYHFCKGWVRICLFACHIGVLQTLARKRRDIHLDHLRKFLHCGKGFLCKY